uniref:Uncharacterized protein n=1 Tax=Glossina pallidipes TaxID=7398 RepID=A0A1B0A285_GLOPL
MHHKTIKKIIVLITLSIFKSRSLLSPSQLALRLFSITKNMCAKTTQNKKHFFLLISLSYDFNMRRSSRSSANRLKCDYFFLSLFNCSISVAIITINSEKALRK